MRICLIITCLLLSFLGNTSAQNTMAQDDPNGPYGIPAVLRALESQFPPGGGFYGVTEKHLNRLGDRASIALIKILEEEYFENPQKVKRALQIIRHSFLYPDMITVSEDKKPKFTLLFLEHIERVVEDSVLKRDILELSKFVKGSGTKVNDPETK